MIANGGNTECAHTWLTFIAALSLIYAIEYTIVGHDEEAEVLVDHTNDEMSQDTLGILVASCRTRLSVIGYRSEVPSCACPKRVIL